MGVDFEIEVEGLDQIQRKLDKNRLLGEPIRQLMSRASIIVQDESKMATPVDTGRLRAAWTHEVASDVIPLWAKVENIVEYATAVEYGTANMEPRHVEFGSQARVLGTGMLTYAVRKVTGKINDLLQQVARLIEGNWGK